MKQDDTALVGAYFHRDPAGGRTAFYPWRSLTKGYWIDSPAREQALRTAMLNQYRMLRIMVPLVIVIPALTTQITDGRWAPGLIVALLLALTHHIWWAWRFGALTRGLARAPRQKAAPGQCRRGFRSVVAAQSYPRLIGLSAGMAVLAICVTAETVTGTIAPGSSAAISLALWALCGLILAQLVTKFRTRRTEVVTANEDVGFLISATRPAWLVIGLLVCVVLARVGLAAVQASP